MKSKVDCCLKVIAVFCCSYTHRLGEIIIFQFTDVCFFSLCSFLTAVQQKAALEKEAKLSILEAGVADVSTSVYVFHFHFSFRFQVCEQPQPWALIYCYYIAASTLLEPRCRDLLPFSRH